MHNVWAGVWCDAEIAEALKTRETQCSEKCDAIDLKCKEREGKLQTEFKEITDKFHQKDKELTACQSDKGGAAAITAKMDAIQKRESELTRWEKELQNQKDGLQTIEKAISEKQENFFAQQAELMKKVGKTEQLEINNRQLEEYIQNLNSRFWWNLTLILLILTVLVLSFWLLRSMRRQSEALNKHISNMRIIEYIPIYPEIKDNLKK
ncbi:MAG: hypothetical protein BWK79_17775 [Beggiatoa sp. IS2]|nr:MAG: hypothetical protein BWK79_17775 [Beggiatoa sp. IS2]